MSYRTPVWLDCDPGHDDAFAIILAAEHPSLELLGISTVHGNAALDRVTENAIRVLTAIGQTEVPVYRGSKKPFMRPSVHAPDIHGESGIDGTNLLPAAAVSHQPGNAIHAMYTAVMKTDYRSCHIIATGTLTNVALLFSTYPDVVDWCAGLSIMGGSFTAGNITKYAEFNIYCDPESANAVFSNFGLSNRITLVPLDLSHQVLATPTVLEVLLHPHGKSSAIGTANEKRDTTPFRQMLHDLLTFFAYTYAEVFNITEGPPLHDPLAVAAILPFLPHGQHDLPQLTWTWEYAKIVVDTYGEEVGRTQKHPAADGETVVRIGMGVDVESFWTLLMRMVSRSDARGKVTWEQAARS